MTINNQKPEPARHGNGAVLDVHSIFPTIQGEGPFIGHPAVFVRLAGCNIQCPGCDTDYTSKRKKVSVEDIAARVLDDSRNGRIRLVVITGGEPLRQDIGQLIYELRRSRFKIQIETNGIICPESVKDFVLSDHHIKLVTSPKTSRIHPFIARHAHAFKYVLQADAIDPTDGLPSLALGHKASPRVARPDAGWVGPVYVNPMDEQDEGKNDRNMQAVLSSCITHGYIAGIQAHKIWNLP